MHDMEGTSELRNTAKWSFQQVQIPVPNQTHANVIALRIDRVSKRMNSQIHD